MHELPVMGSILDIVLKHAQANEVSRVVSISLDVGEMSDLENDWMQHYFDFLTKGTVAENAVLKVNRSPLVVQCGNCLGKFELKRDQLADFICPDCDEKELITIVSGTEYFIRDMEAY